MLKRYLLLAKSLIGAASMLAACSTEEPARSPIAPTLSEFISLSTKHFEDKVIYVADGDMAVTREELRAEYERLFGQLSAEAFGIATQSSTVNQANGHDDLWSPMAALNLRYCVSTEFGVRYNRAINEMSLATAEWEARARINYTYVPTEDGNCTGANTNVTLAVRPWSGGGACAFFPSGGGCVDRTIVIDYDDIDSGNFRAVTSVGVFRHELGHTLGLRHEHIRAPGTTCTEDTNWRGVTAYDADSVMHYPQCPGATNTGDLLITGLDAAGIGSLYPAVLPDPPANMQTQCSADGTRVTVSWSPVAGVTGYAPRLDYIPNNSSSCTDSWLCSALDSYGERAANSYTADVVPNAPYHFWVHSVINGNYGSASDISFTCYQPVPPPNLQQQCSADGTSVTMSWSPVAGATAYAPRLNYLLNDSPSCADGWLCSALDTLDEQAPTSYTMRIVPNSPYRFWVHAKVNGSYGTASAISFTCYQPVPPPNLQQQCSADGTSVTMSWSPVAGATAYAPRLDYIPDDSPSCADGWLCSALDTLAEQAPTSYTMGIVPNSPYHFWVHAKVNGSYGAASHISFTCNAPP